MVKPKIGLSMLYCLVRPFNEMTKNLANVDTNRIEILDEGLHALNKSRVQTLKDLSASYNLEFTMHAPFAEVNIASPSNWMLNATVKRMKKSIINARALDCRLWVFHPGLKSAMNDYFPEIEWKTNVKTARMLHRFAKVHGVNSAIENVPEPYSFIMKTAEDFVRFYDEVDEDIGFVLDLGHAHIMGQIDRFFGTFSKRIVHVHAHDNDGKGDQHLGIGYGNIDWKNVARLFEKIAYDKTIVVESGWHIKESLQKLQRLFL